MKRRSFIKSAIAFASLLGARGHAATEPVKPNQVTLHRYVFAGNGFIPEGAYRITADASYDVQGDLSGWRLTPGTALHFEGPAKKAAPHSHFQRHPHRHLHVMSEFAQFLIGATIGEALALVWIVIFDSPFRGWSRRRTGQDPMSLQDFTKALNRNIAQHYAPQR